MKLLLSITPAGYYRRVVRLIDTETGQQREITYGDSVTERWIRGRAPRLWRVATPIKNKEKSK